MSHSKKDRVGGHLNRKVSFFVGLNGKACWTPTFKRSEARREAKKIIEESLTLLENDWEEYYDFEDDQFEYGFEYENAWREYIEEEDDQHLYGDDWMYDYYDNIVDMDYYMTERYV